MQIHVFKTNIRYPTFANQVIELIREKDAGIRCNFDLSDRDHILRVESNTLQPIDVIATVQLAGFYCEELED
jgi:hypothetical protein